MSDNPFASPTSPEETFFDQGTTPADSLSPFQPLALATTWSKLLGVALIMFGVFMALTISGIILAWMPIWAGVVMWQHANYLNDALRTQNSQVLRLAMAKLATAIKVTTVFLVIMLALTALYLLMLIGMVVWTISNAGPR